MTREYGQQFKNPLLLGGAVLMGTCTSFIYVFATIGPFIAINLFGLTSTEYGIANILPPLGLITGSLLAARLVRKHSMLLIVRMGISITAISTVLMLMTLATHLPALIALFIPLLLIYFGIALILPNASTTAMSSTADKSHGSAVMNFINIGLATACVLSLSHFHTQKMLLPVIYSITCMVLIGVYQWLAQRLRVKNAL